MSSNSQKDVDSSQNPHAKNPSITVTTTPDDVGMSQKDFARYVDGISDEQAVADFQSRIGQMNREAIVRHYGSSQSIDGPQKQWSFPQPYQFDTKLPQTTVTKQSDNSSEVSSGNDSTSNASNGPSSLVASRSFPRFNFKKSTKDSGATEEGGQEKKGETDAASPS